VIRLYDVSRSPKMVRPVPLAIGGLIAMAASVGVGRFVYTPILPPMTAALGMSKSAAGFIASANFLGYLLGALLAATPFVRGSRRTWLIVALATSALTTGTMGLVSTLPAFLFLRFVGGVASAFGLVFSSALVLDRLAGARHSELSAVHFGGVGTGIAVSATVVSTLMAWGFDWRALWLASGVVALGALAIVPALVPDSAEPSRSPAATPEGNGVLAALVIAYGLFGFGYVITATFLVTIVRASAPLQPLEPIVWIVVGVTAVPSVALWTWAGRRFGDARAFAWACVLEAVGVLASVLWITPSGILVAASLLGGTFMGLTALGLIQGRRLGHGDPRRTLAIMTAAFGLGQIVGPASAGVIYDLTGSLVAPSLAAGAALGAAALLAARRRRPAPPA
jgi:predicted MFS family arabinose efflux permease